MPEGFKRQSSFNLQGAQFAGGLVDAETVTAHQIGGNITNYDQNTKTDSTVKTIYSEVQASAIARHIPYVIGMEKAIGDKAAIKFATGFYSALGAGESVEFAYKLGCSVIQLDGIAEHLTPVLKKR